MKCSLWFVSVSVVNFSFALGGSSNLWSYKWQIICGRKKMEWRKIRENFIINRLSRKGHDSNQIVQAYLIMCSWGLWNIVFWTMEEPRYSNLTVFVFVPFIRHPAFVILSPGQFHIEKSTPKLETAHYRIQLKVTYFKN